MRSRALALLLLLPLLAGCDGSKYAKVSGRITLNGQPLANAAVVFSPVAVEGNANPGLGSGGKTDADGRYTLLIAGTETKGAVLGKHKVRIMLISDNDSADDKLQKNKRLPPKYSGKDTELEFEVVPGGSKAADFDLKVP